MYLFVGGAAFVLTIAAAGNDSGDKRSEVLTRGLVHQAFAQPAAMKSEPGFTVKQRPPEPINEIPTRQMPQGNRVCWIPGYWGWDVSRNDFIWVSGVWRDAPPGQRWVPGYWAASDKGYTWVRGFWTAAGNRDLSFLPLPPPAEEVFPTSAAPGSGQFWVPGNWVYRDGRYRWRRGYWAPPPGDWIWIPDSYVWTPRGAIYANGYWDYWPQERGLLFAPMTLAGSRTTLIPQQVIPPTSLLAHLFVQPEYTHYCFGDYYDPAFAGDGIYPWVGAGQYVHGFYDPIRVAYLTGVSPGARAEFGRILGWHDYFRTHPRARPPVTLTESLRLAGEASDETGRPMVLARPLGQLADSSGSSIRLVSVPESRHEEIRRSARQTVDLADRSARLASARTAGDTAQPTLRLALPKIAAPASTLAGANRADRTREEVPEAPQLDKPLEAQRTPFGNAPTQSPSSQGGTRRR